MLQAQTVIGVFQSHSVGEKLHMLHAEVFALNVTFSDSSTASCFYQVLLATRPLRSYKLKLYKAQLHWGFWQRYLRTCSAISANFLLSLHGIRADLC